MYLCIGSWWSSWCVRRWKTAQSSWIETAVPAPWNSQVPTTTFCTSVFIVDCTCTSTLYIKRKWSVQRFSLCRLYIGTTGRRSCNSAWLNQNYNTCSHVMATCKHPSLSGNLSVIWSIDIHALWPRIARSDFVHRHTRSLALACNLIYENQKNLNFATIQVC